MTGALERIETMWVEAFDARDIEALGRHVVDDYELRDHRAAGWGTLDRRSFDDMVEGWWAMIPDARCFEVRALGERGPRCAVHLAFEGTDPGSAQREEVHLSCVFVTGPDGRFTHCDQHETDGEAVARLGAAD